MTYLEQEVASILVDTLGLEDVFDQHDLRRNRNAQFERRLALDVVVVLRVAEDAEDHLGRVLLRVLRLRTLARRRGVSSCPAGSSPESRRNLRC